MSSLLKQRTKKGKPQDGKQWLHPADLLTDGGVLYPVKLLGITEVAQAKGTEVIKEAITKVQFAKHIKQSEAGKKGSKLRKVDLKISISTIKVDDTKTKEEIYSYPLHHISYCADDKRSKKVFAFIAKDKTSPKHTCYVFECEKQAEELTLTVGQAFDLAYRRYLENVGRQKLQAAESERDGMKQKLSELEKSQESTNSDSSNTTAAALTNWPTPAPANNKQDDINLFGDVSLPPPPKNTRKEMANLDTFDPFESSVSTTNGNSSPQMPFDQQPVAPHTISSPFDDSPSPSPIDKVANPFDQMFEQQQKQPSSTFPSDTFGESFDPLDNTPSTTVNKNGNSQASSPFGNGQATSPFDNSQATLPFGNGQATSPFDNSQAILPFGNGQATSPFDNSQATLPFGNGQATLPFDNSQATLPFDNSQATLPFGNVQATSPFDNTSSVDTTQTNNNIYAQPQVQRPKALPRTQIPSTLPPPPSKQSVKAAKAAAASGNVQGPSPTISNSAPPSSQPSSDLFSLDPTRPTSPGNPFSRPVDFDPFADSFDPLGSKPPQANNQIQELQSGFSRGMAFDSNDLLS